MTQTMSPTPTVTPIDRTADRARSRRRAFGWVGAATAAAASVLAVSVVVLGDAPQSASAAVLAAAEQTGKATSLRMVSQLPTTDSQGKPLKDKLTTTGEVDGADFTLVHRSEPSGDTLTITVIGDVRYHGRPEGNFSEKIPAEQRRAPFAKAARNVFRTAVEASDTKEIGTEKIRGVDSTHYRLTVKPPAGSTDQTHPLAKLPATELDWFGVASFLTKPQAKADVIIDLWVADGLIRRSDFTVPAENWQQSNEYFDFDKPITITPPAGS